MRYLQQILKYHVVPKNVYPYKELLDAGSKVHSTLSITDRCERSIHQIFASNAQMSYNDNHDIIIISVTFYLVHEIIHIVAKKCP